MCGIVGIVGFTQVNQSIYDALTVLQHRGQDAAGIATIDSNNGFICCVCRAHSGLAMSATRPQAAPVHRKHSRFMSIHRSVSLWRITAI